MLGDEHSLWHDEALSWLKGQLSGPNLQRDSIRGNSLSGQTYNTLLPLHNLGVWTVYIIGPVPTMLIYSIQNNPSADSPSAPIHQPSISSTTHFNISRSVRMTFERFMASRRSSVTKSIRGKYYSKHSDPPILANSLIASIVSSLVSLRSSNCTSLSHRCELHIILLWSALQNI